MRRSPPERGPAGGADLHRLELPPFGMAVEQEKVAAGRDLAVEVRGLVAFPAAVDLRVLVLGPVQLVLAFRDGAVGRHDAGRRTGIVVLSVDLPRRRVERLGDVGGADAAGVLESDRIADDPVAGVAFLGDLVGRAGGEAPQRVVVLLRERGAVEDVPLPAVADQFTVMDPRGKGFSPPLLGVVSITSLNPTKGPLAGP